LKPQTVNKWGRAVGKALSACGQRRIGRDAWERVEDKFKGTINDFILGVLDGLDSDDKLK
jgi:hypothetical protein